MCAWEVGARPVISASSSVDSQASGYFAVLMYFASPGFRSCAALAVQYGMSDVFDNVLVTLCKFSSLLPTVTSSGKVVIPGGTHRSSESLLALAGKVTQHSSLSSLIHTFSTSRVKRILKVKVAFWMFSLKIKVTFWMFIECRELKGSASVCDCFCNGWEIH